MSWTKNGRRHGPATLVAGVLAVALGVGALGAFPARVGAEAALVFAGSGANLDITRLLAEAFARSRTAAPIMLEHGHLPAE